MFKKEAEEYVNEEYDFCYYPDGVISTRANAERDWLKGAEFGYNKANEWHYVKDGCLPKETDFLMSKTLLLVTKMKGSDCLSLVLGQYNFSTQEFSYQHMVGLTDVIAWKEIVLPESLKS